MGEVARAAIDAVAEEHPGIDAPLLLFTFCLFSGYSTPVSSEFGFNRVFTLCVGSQKFEFFNDDEW